MKLKLHWQIFIAIMAALLLSIVIKYSGGTETYFAERVVGLCEFIGNLFLNGLKMIVVPLIAASIISGMIGIGAEKGFGRMGLKTVSFYLITTFLAVVIGMVCVNVIRPGTVDEETAIMMKSQAKVPEGIGTLVNEGSTSDFVNVFEKMIPQNIFAAAGDNSQLLGVIFFCLIYGFFVTRLPLKHRRFQVKMWQSFQEVTLNMADLVLMFSPIGVFGLVAPKFISFGFALFIPVIKFTVTVLLALGVHFFIVMSIVLWLGGINPITHLKAMAPALITSFSTSSSVSTLPITMECVEKTAGVSNRVSSFTLPLGATVNMNGTALYEGIVIIFVAQFYQIDHPEFLFPLKDQFLVVVMAVMTSIGVAGIPAASIVAIALILGIFGLPFETVGVVLVVDRVLDMCRTMVNIYGDTVAAVVIGKSEGEKGIYETAAIE